MEASYGVIAQSGGYCISVSGGFGGDLTFSLDLPHFTDERTPRLRSDQVALRFPRATFSAGVLNDVRGTLEVLVDDINASRARRRQPPSAMASLEGPQLCVTDAASLFGGEWKIVLHRVRWTLGPTGQEVLRALVPRIVARIREGTADRPERFTMTSEETSKSPALSHRLTQRPLLF